MCSMDVIAVSGGNVDSNFRSHQTRPPSLRVAGHHRCIITQIPHLVSAATDPCVTPERCLEHITSIHHLYPNNQSNNHPIRGNNENAKVDDPYLLTWSDSLKVIMRSFLESETVIETSRHRLNSDPHESWSPPPRLGHVGKSREESTRDRVRLCGTA